MDNPDDNFIDYLDKEKTQRPKINKKQVKKYISLGIMGFLTVALVSVLLYYQFVDDPVVVEQLYDDNPNVKSVTKTTHLKDGTVEYRINVEDGMASVDPRDSSGVIKGEHYYENMAIAEQMTCERLLEYIEDRLREGKPTNPTQREIATIVYEKRC